jgi:hypothetical protein
MKELKDKWFDLAGVLAGGQIQRSDRSVIGKGRRRIGRAVWGQWHTVQCRNPMPPGAVIPTRQDVRNEGQAQSGV